MSGTKWISASLLLSVACWAQPAVPKDATVPEQLGGWKSETPPDGGPKARVDRFRITNNQLLPEEELREIVAPYEGKELSLAEMKAVARKLTARFQRHGYFLVRVYVPRQKVTGGEVELKVLEGKVGQLKVEGAEHYPEDFVKARFLNSFEGDNFKNERFQRAMLLLNEMTDLKVKAVLAPGQEEGTADVTLQVEDALPIHGGVDYNNYGTPETGEHRVGLNFDAGSLFTTADQLSLRGVLGFPGRENSFYQLGYQAPLNDDGLSLSVSYANGAFSVSQGLGAILDVRGRADIFTAGMSYALDRQLDFSSNLGVVLSHKDIRNNFLAAQVPFSRDRYTTARFTYQADWRSPEGRTLLQTAWTQGLGGTSGSDLLVSRQGASPGFSRFNVDLARVQNLDTGLYAVLRASGQYATQPLYLGEQYAVGGPDSVRGFAQAELLGDNAYVLSAELRYSPFHEDLEAFQVAAFIDHGGVGLRNRQAGDLPNGSSLTGAGFGFRFGLGEQANLRLDLGFPISPSSSRNDRSPAIYCGLQTRF